MLGKEACMKFHVHCTGRWLRGPGIYVSIVEPGIATVKGSIFVFKIALRVQIHKTWGFRPQIFYNLNGTWDLKL